MTDVWLRHVGLEGEDGHGGAFLCPEGAVDAWRAMGWEPGEPPEEENPVVAENIAAQRAAAEQAATAEREQAEKKPRKAAKVDADTESKEG